MTKTTLSTLCCLLFLLPLWPARAQQNEAAPPPVYRLDLDRLHHLYQDLNNCGPTTLTMALGFYGYPDDHAEDQYPAADYLKPDPHDQNVSFWQMADYVNLQIGEQYGVRALVRRGGTLELLKALSAADFPLILGKGMDIPDEGWVGHFVFMIGYDDAAGAILTYDSYKGHGDFQGLPYRYDKLEPLWQEFNRVFMVVYPPEREAELQALMGPLWDENAGWEQARRNAEALLAENPDSRWANMNLGEALTALGDYAGAAAAYDLALFQAGEQLPWRALWYLHGAFRAYYEVGDFERVEKLAKRVRQNTRYIEDINYYLALVQAAQGNTEAALELLAEVLDFNPNYYPAAQAQAQILAGTFRGPSAP
jgi:hypothetical protein